MTLPTDLIRVKVKVKVPVGIVKRSPDLIVNNRPNELLLGVLRYSMPDLSIAIVCVVLPSEMPSKNSPKTFLEESDLFPDTPYSKLSKANCMRAGGLPALLPAVPLAREQASRPVKVSRSMRWT
jgi:hypothetical protein